jgi:hypothetical protein
MINANRNQLVPTGTLRAPLVDAGLKAVELKISADRNRADAASPCLLRDVVSL